jgi:hypothetical protein
MAELHPDLSKLKHVRHVDVVVATGIDAAAQALLPRRLFRDRVARIIWANHGRDSISKLQAEPLTFILSCVGDPALYEVWVNEKGRAYARHYVKRE